MTRRACSCAREEAGNSARGSKGEFLSSKLDEDKDDNEDEEEESNADV